MGCSRKRQCTERRHNHQQRAIEDGLEQVSKHMTVEEDKWTSCHSLFLDFREMHKAVTVTAAAARIKQLSLDGSLSSLRCLHIIGRDRVPLTKGSLEGVFVGLLAKHALVLTLHVKIVSMPLEMPKLQHLIVNLSTGRKDGVQTHEALFLAVTGLTGLHTICVQSLSTAINRKTDLTACVHLRCVALQGVTLQGGVSLPAGCLLRVIHRPEHGDTIKHAVGDVVTGIDMHHDTCWTHRLLSTYAVDLLKLTRLRLTMNQQYKRKASEPMMIFYPTIMPALKVLELNVQSNVRVRLLPGLALESLVIIAAGGLAWWPTLCEAPMTTLKQIYLESGTPFMPSYKKHLEESYA